MDAPSPPIPDAQTRSRSGSDQRAPKSERPDASPLGVTKTGGVPSNTPAPDTVPSAVRPFDPTATSETISDVSLKAPARATCSPLGLRLTIRGPCHDSVGTLVPSLSTHASRRPSVMATNAWPSESIVIAETSDEDARTPRASHASWCDGVNDRTIGARRVTGCIGIEKLPILNPPPPEPATTLLVPDP